MIVLRAKRQRCARMTQRSLFRLTLLFDPVAGPVRVHSRRVRPEPLPPRATQTITFPPETDKACSQTKGQNLPFCPPFGTVRNGAVSGQRTGWGTRLVNPSAMLCGWESTFPTFLAHYRDSPVRLLLRPPRCDVGILLERVLPTQRLVAYRHATLSSISSHGQSSTTMVRFLRSGRPLRGVAATHDPDRKHSMPAPTARSERRFKSLSSCQF